MREDGQENAGKVAVVKDAFEHLVDAKSLLGRFEKPVNDLFGDYDQEQASPSEFEVVVDGCGCCCCEFMAEYMPELKDRIKRGSQRL